MTVNGVSLSERETQVLELFAAGWRGVDIAKQLFLSVKTIATYKARLRIKLAIETPAQWVDALNQVRQLAPAAVIPATVSA